MTNYIKADDAKTKKSKNTLLFKIFGMDGLTSSRTEEEFNDRKDAIHELIQEELPTLDFDYITSMFEVIWLYVCEPVISNTNLKSRRWTNNLCKIFLYYFYF